ncbi:ABC-2 type transport system ATP-binding protein [Paraoerskovia marina]|uniref:ABC-2 type transport system ATP-binding protein n=1 Tax=Paraoerskovia marina TaxID=545619 RepID=A0A1H1M8F0_9CELL|nr:ABC transporter ATP-binding protein [Paraoerskovia marina]SDR83114.1 ABC-2 type transport system ATP-binding protein [Paraoerskovia marina]
MLVAEQVHRAYGARSVLNDISITINTGVTALLGVNGAGKTTLLSILAGALRPDSGSVRIDDEEVFGSSASRRRALGKVALMPQSATFPPHMTALEVVEYLTWMRGASARHARIVAKDALRRVLLDDRASSKIKTLSGGMVRRVCLAQAIASGAEHLCLDEPSTGLDPQQRRAMVGLLAELEGTVLLSSHVMEDVADLAQNVLVLDAGAIIFAGGLADLADLAPDGVDERRAEAGFLSVLTSSVDTTPRQ